MGLLSNIWKGAKKLVKKVWKGVTKVFKAVMKPIGKLLNSDIGKAIMLGVTIFSLGPALMAGGKAFMAGEGFIGKFVDAGGAFMETLLGTAVEGAAGAGAAPDAAGAAVAEMTPSGVSTTAVDALDVGADVAAATAPAASGPLATAAQLEKVGNMQKMSALTEPAKDAMAAKTFTDVASTSGGGGNWLTRAAKAASDFATSPGGGTIIGNMMQGVGAGMMEENRQDFESRVERMFEDPNNAGMRALRDRDYTIDAPRNLAGNVARGAPGNIDRPVPTVPFYRTPYQGG